MFQEYSLRKDNTLEHGINCANSHIENGHERSSRNIIIQLIYSLFKYIKCINSFLR